MKRKVTKFTAEIILNDLANDSYLEDIADDEDIHKVKLLKSEDIEIDIEDDDE